MQPAAAAAEAVTTMIKVLVAEDDHIRRMLCAYLSAHL